MKTKFNGILTLLLAFVVQLTFAQEKTISGTVVDETNMPLPGATVVIKGTTTGASTDFDGKYTITANTGDVLTFSYVGYSEQDATVAASNTIDIALVLDNSLEEVVITALGVKRKVDAVTSSNQVVKSEEITQAANPNVAQSLAGKVSGLQINTTSTGLSPNTDIILRGSSSVSGNNNALIVIDNIISTAGTLSSLDPSSIDSVNVMKGASGAALYGSRGGNGVIIVTTVKGAKGDEKFTINLKSTVTFEEIAFLPKRQDRFGQGWLGDLDILDQSGWGPEFDGKPYSYGIPYPTDTDYTTGTYEHIEDNIKPFFQTGVTLQNSAALSAGNSDGYINLNMRKLNVEGIIPGNERHQEFFGLSAGKKLGKFKVSGLVRYTTTTTDRSNNSAYSNLNKTASNIRIQDFNSGSNNDHWNQWHTSPYWTKKHSRIESSRNRIDAQADIQYFFNDNINVILRGGLNTFYDNTLSKNDGFVDELEWQGVNRDIVDRFDKSQGDYRLLYEDLIFNFDYNLTEDLHFTALLGGNLSERKTNDLTLGGPNLTIPGVYSIGNLEGQPDNLVQNFSLERDAAIYVAPSLEYKDYLFLNLSARNEWTSKLNEDNRSFLYYSGGLAFVPTKAFPEMKGKAIQKLKLSASYTLSGNTTGVNPYDINYRAFQAPGYPFTSGNSYIATSTRTDFNLVNEDVYTTEFNLNADLLRINNKSRISLDFAYYTQSNENQILATSTSNASGLGTAKINVGKTKTDGFEIDLGLTPVKTDDLEWNIGLGYSTSKTIVKKVTEQSDQVLTASYQDGSTVGLYAIEGEEFPLIQGTSYTRDDEGRIVVDANGNPLRNTELKTLGKVTPDYIINFKTGLTYKDFRLNAVLDYRTGHQFFSSIANDMSGNGLTVESAFNGRQEFLLPNSTVEGSGVTNTSVFTGGSSLGDFQNYISNNYTAVDENFVLDATAIKLRELSLSYSLPTEFLNNSFLNDLTLSVSGRNLYTWLPKENRGYNDPEIGSGLGYYGQTPPTRSYNVSLSLTF